MDSPHSGHGNAVLLFSTNGRPEEVQMSVLAAITLSLSEAGEPPLPFSVDRRQDGNYISSVFSFRTWNGLKSASLYGISGIAMDKSELSLTGEQVDLSKYVEDAGGIHGLRDIDKFRGWNNIEYGAGLSGKNTPATKLSMNKAFIPPGGVAAAHIHVDFDVMVFLLKGSVRHEFGPGCRKSVVHSAGDMFYIEPGLPHEVFNCSDTDWVEAIVARSDASEWQNIVPYDRDSE